MPLSLNVREVDERLDSSPEYHTIGSKKMSDKHQMSDIGEHLEGRDEEFQLFHNSQEYVKGDGKKWACKIYASKDRNTESTIPWNYGRTADEAVDEALDARERTRKIEEREKAST